MLVNTFKKIALSIGYLAYFMFSIYCGCVILCMFVPVAVIEAVYKGITKSDHELIVASYIKDMFEHEWFKDK